MTFWDNAIPAGQRIKEIEEGIEPIKTKILENAAAIGTEIAAQKYGMTILRKQIEDNPNNFTRFFVLGSKDAGPTGLRVLLSIRDDGRGLWVAVNAHL